VNPRERLLAAIRGGAVDRVPLVLEGFHAACPQEVEAGPKREILDRIGRETHFFVNPPFRGGNRYLMTPLHRMREVARHEENGSLIVTTEIDTPKGALTAVTGRNPLTNTTWTVKYPVTSRQDIEKIRSVPWERPPGLAPPDLGDLPAAFAERGVVRAGVSSPFVCVAGMMSYEWFLELCATDLELIKELTAQCEERVLDVLEVILAGRSVEYVWVGGSEWVTPPMGSPRLYDELVQTFERRVIQRIHEGGAVSHIHCHGNVRHVLEMVIARGGDFFEPVEPPPDGDITFAEAKAVAGGRITLGGNIEARILENEGADAVERAVRAAFEGGKQRMVLQSTAGPLCAMTPRMLENYHRMVDVWEELSEIGAEDAAGPAGAASPAH
jgi:uroporphyrinogen-III decarboxylase